MVGGWRNEYSAKLNSMGAFEIHTEQQNGHWVGWITREGDPKPYRSVLLVAASREEAEKRANAWAERASD